MQGLDHDFPEWALDILVCPDSKESLTLDNNRFVDKRGNNVGSWEHGIARFAITENDSSILWYESKGGTNFQERMAIPFTMSSLDTPVYHSYLELLKPNHALDIVVDVGSGDGRNIEPWLEWGHQRIVAVDPIASSLVRLRDFVSEKYPEKLGHLLLVQADARRLPLMSDAAQLVFAIEALCCMNEDYELGLAECGRIVSPSGRLMVSERAWEGNMLTRLLYGGVRGMIEMQNSRYLVDGPPDNLVRTRTFTEDELVSIMEKTGLAVLERKGVSVLSIVLGYLRGEHKVSVDDEQYLGVVNETLELLGNQGKSRRAHVLVAKKGKMN